MQKLRKAKKFKKNIYKRQRKMMKKYRKEKMVLREQ